jgi:RNA polymerase sigma-70 factor (ECF subfamily)
MAATRARRTRPEHEFLWARDGADATAGRWRPAACCPCAPATRGCRCGSQPAAPLFALAGDDGRPDAADHATFERLYRAINPRLQRFVRREEPAEADDISADVWLAVARYLPRFRGDADGFEALIFTIARRRITDHRRRRARRRTDLVANESLADHPGDDEPESEALDQLRTRATLEELVRALSPAQVEVVVLRIVHGLPVERVATMLGRSPGNVRILQHRALKRLRAS